LVPAQDEGVGNAARRLAGELRFQNAEVVRAIAFGELAAAAELQRTLRRELGDSRLQVTWVCGTSVAGQPLAGVQVHAVIGAEVRDLGARAGGLTARLWRDGSASHCMVSGPTLPTGNLNRSEQTVNYYAALSEVLTAAGMTLKHVARTWFFLEDILSWYGEFNQVRNDCFARNELRAGSVPASTGVGARNPAGNGLAVVVWGIQPHPGAPVDIEPVASPMQCAAPAYGSAFSRALEINANGHRQLLISGTASIAPDGKTAHVGDVTAQIDLTMRVVDAILASRGFSWGEISRATAYFKSVADAPVFDRWLAEHGQEGMPVVKTGCDVCRDDLLFELELDAIQPS
jgi:enamine deaminase RidA (YjgF/YER057c/UK114 family)